MSDDIISKLFDVKTRTRLEKKSSEFGFVDSEEAIRYLVNGFINGNLELVEELDDETAKKVLQSQQEIKKGQSFVIEPGDPIDLDKIFGD